MRGAEGAPTADGDAAGGASGDDAAPDDFTGTNNQEEGVDELDLAGHANPALQLAHAAEPPTPN